MSDKLTLIRIESGNHGGNTPISVNGGPVKRIPHNEDVGLTEAEIEVLGNSNAIFQIVSGPGVPQPEASGAGAGGSSPASETDEERETREKAEAAETQRRADVLAAAQDEAKSVTLPDGFLDRKINLITADLDDKPLAFLIAVKTAEEAAGAAAEKGRPRTTLVGALEAKIDAAVQVPAA
jgi:hypothetical protein